MNKYSHVKMMLSILDTSVVWKLLRIYGRSRLAWEWAQGKGRSLTQSINKSPLLFQLCLNNKLIIMQHLRVSKESKTKLYQLLTSLKGRNQRASPREWRALLPLMKRVRALICIDDLPLAIIYSIQSFKLKTSPTCLTLTKTWRKKYKNKKPRLPAYWRRARSLK